MKQDFVDDKYLICTLKCKQQWWREVPGRIIGTIVQPDTRARHGSRRSSRKWNGPLFPSEDVCGKAVVERMGWIRGPDRGSSPNRRIPEKPAPIGSLTYPDKNMFCVCVHLEITDWLKLTSFLYVRNALWALIYRLTYRSSKREYSIQQPLSGSRTVCDPFSVKTKRNTQSPVRGGQKQLKPAWNPGPLKDAAGRRALAASPVREWKHSEEARPRCKGWGVRLGGASVRGRDEGTLAVALHLPGAPGRSC